MPRATDEIFSSQKNWRWRPLPANLRQLEQQRESFLSKATKEKQNAAELAARIEELPCTLARPAGESEKLFGSVTAMDLQKFLQEQGISLDRRKIHLANPIKTIGSYYRSHKTSPGRHRPTEGECGRRLPLA